MNKYAAILICCVVSSGCCPVCGTGITFKEKISTDETISQSRLIPEESAKNIISGYGFNFPVRRSLVTVVCGWAAQDSDSVPPEKFDSIFIDDRRYTDDKTIFYYLTVTSKRCTPSNYWAFPYFHFQLGTRSSEILSDQDLRKLALALNALGMNVSSVKYGVIPK